MDRDLRPDNMLFGGLQPIKRVEHTFRTDDYIFRIDYYSSRIVEYVREILTLLPEPSFLALQHLTMVNWASVFNSVPTGQTVRSMTFKYQENKCCWCYSAFEIVHL